MQELYLPIRISRTEYQILNLEANVKKMMEADIVYGVTEFGRLVIIKYGRMPMSNDSLRQEHNGIEGKLIWEVMNPEEMLTHKDELVRYFGKVRLHMNGGGYY